MVMIHIEKVRIDMSEIKTLEELNNLYVCDIITFEEYRREVDKINERKKDHDKIQES